MAHILLAEDQKAFSDNIKERLEAAGHKVTLCESVREAQEVLQSPSSGFDIATIFEILRSNHPNVAIIGHSSDASYWSSKAQDFPQMKVVKKGRVAPLLTAIEELLATPE